MSRGSSSQGVGSKYRLLENFAQAGAEGGKLAGEGREGGLSGFRGRGRSFVAMDCYEGADFCRGTLEIWDTHRHLPSLRQGQSSSLKCIWEKANTVGMGSNHESCLLTCWGLSFNALLCCPVSACSLLGHCRWPLGPVCRRFLQRVETTEVWRAPSCS